ncbi:hypothetical protein [Nonomuraea rubra]|uniref:hypothetical protein n=1 Tax=Nonomuraea rubra TaxID=46180 RepID=UPI0033C9507B
MSLTRPPAAGAVGHIVSVDRSGAHLVMIIRIVLVAAGITNAIHHFTGHVNPWWLGSGTAIFLIGHAFYRAMLRSGRVADRLVAAVCVVPLGLVTSFAGRAAMAAVMVVLGAVAAIDHRLATRGLT